MFYCTPHGRNGTRRMNERANRETNKHLKTFSCLPPFFRSLFNHSNSARRFCFVSFQPTSDSNRTIHTFICLHIFPCGTLASFSVLFSMGKCTIWFKRRNKRKYFEIVRNKQAGTMCGSRRNNVNEIHWPYGFRCLFQLQDRRIEKLKTIPSWQRTRNDDVILK